jgi:colanic acid/amylovoran biosynthesis glycosyltransferase
LSALARLKNEVALEITLIGDARSDVNSRREKQKIIDEMRRGGLEKCVRFLGYQPHSKIFEEAYRSHAFIAASITASDGDSEGGAPVILSEMAATGIPIISTRHCDIPFVLDHGNNGLLADEGDVDGLTDNLRWLIQHPDEWSPMLSSARRHMEEAFDACIQGVRLAELYEKVIDNNS